DAPVRFGMGQGRAGRQDQGGEGGPVGRGQVFDREAFGLSEQEAEVMRLVSCGLSNREIADKLCLSEGTVRNYISNILAKLNLRDRTNLAIFYLTGGKPARAD
ncbi:MAG: response regulator transcription factor, partial [Lachnospiraceae bacterium]|nr:response regulator transcription factor [Lachnospiraceae bacterium]